MKAGEGPERGVLKQILGVGPVSAAQPQRRAKQRVQMFGEDLFECPRGAVRLLQLKGPFGDAASARAIYKDTWTC